MGTKKPKPLTATGLRILVTNGRVRYKIGTKKAKGDIHATWNDTIKFTCDTPFAVFIGELTEPAGATAKPHGWADDSTGVGSPVFAAPVNESKPDTIGGGHHLDLQVDAQASAGSHKYSVVVFDDDGTLVTDDPQIIVD